MRGSYLDGSSGSGMGSWTTLFWLRMGQVGGTCESGNEPSGAKVGGTS